MSGFSIPNEECFCIQAELRAAWPGTFWRSYESDQGGTPYTGFCTSWRGLDLRVRPDTGDNSWWGYAYGGDSAVAHAFAYYGPTSAALRLREALARELGKMVAELAGTGTTDETAVRR